MSIWKKALLAGTMSWTFSVTLGLLFAARASGHFSLDTLRLPGVVPVALIVSTFAAILLLPIALWSARTGVKNLYVYAPILWAALAIYEVVIVPRIGRYGLCSLCVLAIIGSVVLGLIPASEAGPRVSENLH